MQNTNKIRYVSSALIFTSYSIMLFWCGFVYATLFNVFTGRDALDDYLSDRLIPTLLRMGESELSVGIPAAIVYFMPTAVGIYALWRLSCLFRLYRDGEYFTREGANHLYIFALLFCLIHLLQTPILGVADYILTLGNDLTPYGMPLNIDGDEVSQLVFYLTFVLVSWILREAFSISEENKEFV